MKLLLLWLVDFFYHFYFILCFLYIKKRLKIPKEQSEAVNRKRDNIMVKWKMTNNDLQYTTQKTKHRARYNTLVNVMDSCDLKGWRVHVPLVAPLYLSCYKVILFTSHDRGNKNEIVTSTRGSYLWSYVTHIFCNGCPSRNGDLKTFVIQ
jgi:hypothetical protein